MYTRMCIKRNNWIYASSGIIEIDAIRGLLAGYSSYKKIGTALRSMYGDL